MPLDSSNCRTISIILRVCQLVLGFITIGCANTAAAPSSVYVFSLYTDNRVLSFLTCTTTYLTPSFLLLIATCHRESFENMRKSIFELIYNMFGAVIQGINAIMILAITSKLPTANPNLFYAAGVMALLNAALYFVSFFISLKARQAQ